MTQYLLSVHASEEAWQRSPEEMEQAFADTAAFNEKLRDAGVYVFAGGLRPVESATVVRRSGDDLMITDGPYTETKEYLGGFWIINAADLDEALSWARQAAVACRESVEIRPFDDETQRANQ
ncbi:MAG TPA: YciI family protein [Pseudonocardiaceae bacterium]|nr:YciI family protein [Pseudonocardiaceae bacterium]